MDLSKALSGLGKAAPGKPGKKKKVVDMGKMPQKGSGSMSGSMPGVMTKKGK